MMILRHFSKSQWIPICPEKIFHNKKELQPLHEEKGCNSFLNIFDSRIQFINQHLESQEACIWF